MQSLAMAFEIAEVLRSKGPLQSMRGTVGQYERGGSLQSGARGLIGERVDMQLPTPFSSVVSEILTHNTAANGSLLQPKTVAELQRLLQAVTMANVGDALKLVPISRPSILPQLRVAKQLVPRVVFGTLFLAKTPHAFALLDAAWEQGVNAFDCAAIYGDGRCESVLGQWLTVRKVDRRHVWLMSKGGCHGQDRQWASDLGAETVASHLRGSLQRLGVSYLDLYLLHRDDETVSERATLLQHTLCSRLGCPHSSVAVVHAMDCLSVCIQVPVAAVVDMMAQFHDVGLIRAWGVSNWSFARLRAAHENAIARGLPPPVCDSLQVSLARPCQPVWPNTTSLWLPEASSRERIQWYHARNVVVLAWECLAKGFCTGRWAPEDAVRIADLRAAVALSADPTTAPQPTGETSGLWREMQLVSAYCTPENFARLERARRLAKLSGISLAQVALRCVL